jgi:hypothetical protein
MDERAASRRAEVAAQHTGSRGTAPPAWVAWSLSGVGFALVGAALVPVVLGSRPGGADAENFSQGVATTVAFALVGGLVASRRPSNPLGWLFLGIGLSGALGVLTERYAAYALVVEPGSLPGAVPVAWLGAFAWFPAFGLVPLALLLFPDGRLPGRRWRAAAWAAAGGLVVCTVCLALIFLGDPVASVTAEGANPSPPPAVLAAAALGVAALVASGVAAVAAVVLRWRRSGGDQRQQLKCLVLAAATFLGSTLFGVVAANWLDVPGAGLAGLVGAVAVPVGAAVAILRYRLYDLDLGHQPDDCLWAAHRPAGSGLRGRGGAGPPAAGVGRVPAGGRRLHPGRRRLVPAGPASGPGRGGPALRPAPLRCRPDRGGVQRPPARRGRPGDAHR